MTDRDRSIEQLLRRAGAPNDEPPGQCLDAETMAALADDSLPAGARRDAEAHLADCGRCQAVTAAMVRAQAPAGAMAIEVSRARRPFNWLVPATAAATAVALWVLMPGQPTAPEISDSQTSATPRAAAVDAERRGPAPSPAPLREEMATASPTTNLTDRRSSAPAELARALPTSEMRQEAMKVQESARADAGAVGNSADGSVQASAPEAPAPAAASLQASAPARDAGAREADAVAQQRAAAVSVRAAFDIASPNPRIRWRVGPAATIERTEDQGATWTPQQVGAPVEVTAGSSPASDVCWLVGRGGIVLRTVDAGRSWQRTTLPDAPDAVAVTASTGVDAMVSLADGRRLTTSDGGRTWAPEP